MRFVLVIAAMAATAAFLQARSRPEQLPDRLELARFPLQMGEWRGRVVPIGDEVREVLGDGDFADRFYLRPASPPLDLFIAYFPTQRTGSSIHSPKNCLPGSGWTPLESGRLALRAPDGRTLSVNRYIVARGADRQLVLYWYQSHARVVASEYWAKIYLVLDAIRMNRSDGALVRVITPIGSQEDARAAEQRAAQFATNVLPTLDSYVPR